MAYNITIECAFLKRSGVIIPYFKLAVPLSYIVGEVEISNLKTPVESTG